jgi:hypothetical protein
MEVEQLHAIIAKLQPLKENYPQHAAYIQKQQRFVEYMIKINTTRAATKRRLQDDGDGQKRRTGGGSPLHVGTGMILSDTCCYLSRYY